MDKFSKEDYFTAILASEILIPYLEHDSDLAEMIKSPNHPDIHYYETPAAATELTPALKRRLEVMAAKNIPHNFDATKQLVAFMERYPNSLIYNVTFNCPSQHYGVRCGWVDNQIYAVCVMTGGHIPDALLGESAK